jgi:hypothetical protein
MNASNVVSLQGGKNMSTSVTILLFGVGRSCLWVLLNYINVMVQAMTDAQIPELVVT